MSLRYVLLAAGAVLVLGVAVYLFFAVRAEPAPGRVAVAHGAREPARAGAADAARAEEGGPPARATQARTPPAGEAEAPRPAASPVREPPRGPDGEPTDVAPHRLDAVMAEANKAYDRGDLDEAKDIARRVLRTSPNNVRMLRIVVSASCIAGDPAEAQAAYAQLPQHDRAQMKTRCARYGVDFTDP